MSSRDAKMQYIITPVLFQIFSRMTVDMPLNDIKTDINFADLQNFLMSRWILLQNYLLTKILGII